jgi:hypothetical protein
MISLTHLFYEDSDAFCNKVTKAYAGIMGPSYLFVGFPARHIIILLPSESANVSRKGLFVPIPPSRPSLRNLRKIEGLDLEAKVMNIQFL